jgi:hypothetical protein
MDPIKRLLEIATHEVGTHEVGGNNCGPRIVEYQSATWLKPAPWPWCSAFICWILREWLKSQEVLAKLSLRNDKEGEKWRPQTAGAFDFERWAKEKGLAVLNKKSLAKAGDIVIFDFSHIGLIVKDQISPDTIECIEGNTNGGGQRDSNTGDGVWRKRRAASLVRSFIRIIR